MNRFKDITIKFSFVTIIFVMSLIMPINSKILNYSNSYSSKIYKAVGPSSISNSLLLKNITYNGTISTDNLVLGATGPGSLMYSDLTDTISSIPFRYYNSETVLLPSSDNILVNSSLLSFDVAFDITIIVLRDSSVPVPSWLSSYTLSSDKVTTNTLKTYDIYLKEFSAGSTVTIGSNADTSANGALGSMQVVMAKETRNVSNANFFNENFNNYTSSSLSDGYYYSDAPGIASITIDKPDSGTNALKFSDNANGSMAYMIKHFTPLSDKFSISYKLYIDNSVSTQKYIRTWLSTGKPTTNVNNGLAIESYGEIASGGLKITSRTSTTTSTGARTLASGYSLNTWHTIRYDVDVKSKNFVLYIDDVRANGTNNITASPFVSQSTATSIDTIQLATGNNSSNLFYIDDLIITPESDIGISEINVNGNNIQINENTTSYTIVTNELPSTSTITLTKTQFYKSHTITNYENYSEIEVTNEYNEKYRLNLVFVKEGIMNNVTVHNDIDATATNESTLNSDTIHFVDSSTTQSTYIEKSFTGINTSLRYSYEIYLTDTFSNENLKFLLTNGAIGNDYTTYTTTGVYSYMTPVTSTTNETMSFVEEGITVSDDTIISKNSWHKVSYDVDIINQKYRVYLDDIIIYESESTSNFYTEQLSLNNIVIGTDETGTGEFYIRNIEVEETTSAPINGISVEGINVLNFDNTNSYQNVYTDIIYNNSLNVSLITNSYYVSHALIYDSNSKTIQIDIINNLGDTVTYYVTLTKPSSRPTTRNDLQTLVNTANLLEETVYTFNTWNNLQNRINEAQIVLDDENAINKDYALAYYNLESALAMLLTNIAYEDGKDKTITELGKTANYVEYETSLVDTIFYSSNLTTDDFKFENVLENGGLVYNNDSYNNFTWQSIPYKYMNAEYLLLNNEINKNVSFQFTALQDIDILVFKDWDSGPVTDMEFSNTLLNNEPLRKNSEEIAVATGSVNSTNKKVIYYIYKKSYQKGDIIHIDGNNLINNELTNNNSIIAFIKTANSNNNYFLYENIDDYDGLEVTLPDNTIKSYTPTRLYDKAWVNMVSKTDTVTSSGNTQTVIEYDDINDIRYIHQVSSDGDNMAIVQKEFADLTEKVELKFDYYTEPIAIDNLWLRTWLTSFEGVGAITGSSNDQKKALVDIYVEENNMLINSSSASKSGRFGRISEGQWYNYIINFDILSQRFGVKINGVEQVFPFTYNGFNYDNTFINTGTSALTSTNHVYFASRASAASSARIKNIYVTPIRSGLYQDLLIDNTSLGCGENSTTCISPNEDKLLYQDYTKSYIYKTLANSNVTLTTSKNALLTYNNESITNNIDAVNYKYATVNSGLVNIDANDYERSYTVYYEVESSNSRELLVDELNTCLKLKSIYYTNTSWDNLLAKLEIAKSALENHKLTQTEIETITTDLYQARLALVEDVEFNYSYNGFIKEGKQYDDFISSNVNITSKSSLSVMFDLETTTQTSTYQNASLTHSRYLVSDINIPVGTTITMNDSSNGSDNYYYYNVTESKKEFALSDFIKVGTTNTTYINTYNYDSATRILKDTFKFIIDFNNSNTPLTSEHSFTFKLNIDNIEVSTCPELKYNLYNENSSGTLNTPLNLNSYKQSDSMTLNVNFTLNDIISNDITVTDTTLIDKLLGINITLLDNNNSKIEFPKGTTITSGGNTYTLDNDGIFRINKNTNISSFISDFVINYNYLHLNINDYKIKTDIIWSYDGTNNGEVISSDTKEFRIIESPKCSIKSSLTNNTNYINKNSIYDLNLSVETLCSSYESDEVLTVSLYRKNNNLFNSFDYTLVDYNSYVNNNTLALFSNNIYTLNTRTYYSEMPQNFNGNYIIDLKDNIVSGTYKLKIDVRVNDNVVSDEISFVIK